VTQADLVVSEKDLLPLGPSSTILLEFSSKSDVADGATTVKAFVDDQEVPLKACNGATPCKASDFKDALNTSV